jgi:hypothetical protein
MGEEGVPGRAREEGLDGGDSMWGGVLPPFTGDLQLANSNIQHQQMNKYIQRSTKHT